MQANKKWLVFITNYDDWLRWTRGSNALVIVEIKCRRFFNRQPRTSKQVGKEKKGQPIWMAVVRYNCSRHTALNVSAWNFLHPTEIMMYSVYTADVIEVLCSVFFVFLSRFHNTHQFVARNVDDQREKNSWAKPKQTPLFSMNLAFFIRESARGRKKIWWMLVHYWNICLWHDFLCKSNTSSRLFALLRMISVLFSLHPLASPSRPLLQQ